MSILLPMVVLGQPNDHACLYCGAHDCEQRWQHERWWGGSDEYARKDVRERIACTGCGQPINDGEPCAARLVPVLVGSLRGAA